LFGLALLFSCLGHVRYPQISEQKKEPSRDGPSRRLLYAAPN
jgi:hypothetical protein